MAVELQQVGAVLHEGRVGAKPFGGPRQKPYPIPALPLNTEATLLTPPARKLGLHPFPIPMAIHPKPYQGGGGWGVRTAWGLGEEILLDAKGKATERSVFSEWGSLPAAGEGDDCVGECDGVGAAAAEFEALAASAGIGEQLRLGGAELAGTRIRGR